jgi:hypothetical protein
LFIMDRFPVSLKGASYRIFLTASVLLASAGTVEACSCYRADLSVPCELYGRVRVAFIGRAVDVPPGAGGTVRFQVRRALKGVGGGEVSVLNDDSGVGCGYPFESGQEYLVFAGRNKDGAIEIPGCSTTIWRTSGFASTPAAAFIESLGRPATGGRIFGDVELVTPPVGFSEPVRTPIEGATVMLRGGGPERRTTTVKGRYEFPRLPPGIYNVSVSMPAGFPPARSTRIPEHPSDAQRRLGYKPEPSRSVTITPDQSCKYAPFEADPPP